MSSEIQRGITVAVQIVVEPDDSGFHAYCPALRGIHVSGDTEQEAVRNASDAVIAYLHSLIKHGEPIPVGIVVDEERHRISSKTAVRHTENLVLSPA